MVGITDIMIITTGLIVTTGITVTTGWGRQISNKAVRGGI